MLIPRIYEYLLSDEAVVSVVYLLSGECGECGECGAQWVVHSSALFKLPESPNLLLQTC